MRETFSSRDGSGSFSRWCAGACGLAATLLALALYRNWTLGLPMALEPRGPAEEGSLAEGLSRSVRRVVDLEGTWVAGSGTEGEDWGSWPGFRGPERSNRVFSKEPLADIWPEEGPPVLWSIPMGEGHAAAAVWEGRVLVLDYDEALEGDALRCLSLETGEEIWRRWYRKPTKRNHGISRTIPAVSDGYVVTLGPQCQVLCVRAEDGSFVWGRDLPSSDGTEIPLWYTGQCPRIDDGVVVLAPFGPDVSLLGLDLATGEELWRAPNPSGWTMSHGSIERMEVGGVSQYVYAALGGVVGVKADGPDRGALLWSTDVWRPSVQAASALSLGGGRVLLVAGYGMGACILRVEPDAASETGWRVEVERQLSRREFGSEQQTPILAHGILYGVMPPDGGSARRELVALRSSDASRLWASGSEDRFGIGPYLLINDNRMLILSDDGVLTLASVGPEGYRRLARAKLLHHRDAWGPLALVGGRLLLRDDRTMICVDLRAR